MQCRKAAEIQGGPERGKTCPEERKLGNKTSMSWFERIVAVNEEGIQGLWQGASVCDWAKEKAFFLPSFLPAVEHSVEIVQRN